MGPRDEDLMTVHEWFDETWAIDDENIDELDAWTNTQDPRVCRTFDDWTQRFEQAAKKR